MSMTINEEVEVIEWAPAVFDLIKCMDGITSEDIEKSLDTEMNCKQLSRPRNQLERVVRLCFQVSTSDF